MIKFGKCGCICNSWLGECMVRSQKYLGPRIPYFKHECNSFGCAIYCWCQMSRLNHFKIDTDKNLSTDSKAKFKHVTDKYAGPSGRAVLGVGLQQLACWECWFESHRGHACLCIVRVAFCQVEVLCVELITHPEESYRLWRVVVCDLETSRIMRPWPALGRIATGGKKQINKIIHPTSYIVWDVYLFPKRPDVTANFRDDTIS